MKLFYCWVEDKATKKIVDGYVGNSYQKVDDMLLNYGYKPEYEVFLRDSRESRSWWWSEPRFKWVICNWDCKVPDNLEMRLLVGAV